MKALSGPCILTSCLGLAVWLGLSDLFDLRNRRPYELALPSGPMTFESILVDGYTIWGLTERVLAQLAEPLDPRQAAT